MKTYNETISVEVSVDAIAQKLFAIVNESTPNRDEIVDSIVGPLLAQGKLSYMYNALNGFNNDISFKVGDRVICSEAVTLYDGDRRIYEKTPQVMIIKAINLYETDKVTVEYNNNKEISTKRVNHTNLTLA